MWKWIGGIAASIIAALTIWWLTHEGGPLNPRPAPAPAVKQITVTDVDFGDVVAADPVRATFTVHNQAATAAEDCGLYWSSTRAGEDASVQQAWPAQPIFGLAPHASRTLTVTGRPLGVPAEYQMRYVVACDRHDSKQYVRQVVAR